MSKVSTNLAHALQQPAPWNSANELNAALSREDLVIYSHVNEAARSEAQSVLVSVSDRGGFLGVEPLIRYLLNDPRCSKLTVFAAGIAAQDLKPITSDRFHSLTPSNGPSRIRELIETLRNLRSDILIATVESETGPQSLAILEGKGHLQVKKLFLVVEAYDGLGGVFKRCADEIHAEEVDGIFCNDELSKEVALSWVSNFPIYKIHVTGTGQQDSRVLANQRRAEYRMRGLQTFSLSGDEVKILFLGDLSDYGPGIDSDINEKTWALTLNSIIQVARRNPEREFALMLRPHPNLFYTRNGELFAELKRYVLPDNFKFRSARKEFVELNEAVSCADCIMGLSRDEMFNANLRSIPGFFLAYETPGLGKTLLEREMSAPVQKAFSRQPGLTLVRSPKHLEACITELMSQGINAESANRQFTSELSAPKIANLIF